MFCDRYVELDPAEPSGVVELADVKSFLGVSVADFDDELTALIAVASQMVEAYCRRPFSQRTVVETIVPHETYAVLSLDKPPLITLTSVTKDGEAVDASTLRVNKPAGLVRFKDGSGFEAADWVFTYTAGDTPDPVARAVKELVRDIRASDKRPAGVSKESVPDVGAVEYSDLYPDGYHANGVRLPATVAAMLAPYVLRYT